MLPFNQIYTHVFSVNVVKIKKLYDLNHIFGSFFDVI